MHPSELTYEERVRIVAGMVRNNIPTATIFSPHDSLHLAYRDGYLCRTSLSVGHFDRQFTPIVSVEELMEMTDEEIFMRVEG